MNRSHPNSSQLLIKFTIKIQNIKIGKYIHFLKPLFWTRGPWNTRSSRLHIRYGKEKSETWLKYNENLLRFSTSVQHRLCVPKWKSESLSKKKSRRRRQNSPRLPPASLSRSFAKLISHKRDAISLYDITHRMAEKRKLLRILGPSFLLGTQVLSFNNSISYLPSLVACLFIPALLLFSSIFRHI